MSRNVYNSIDITKFLMAILVIAIHTTNLQNCNIYWNQNVFYNFADLAVPFFFICSSFFLSIKCQDVEKTEEKIWIVKKYFWRIARLYLLWNLVYLPFAIYGFVINRDSLTKAILKYIVDLIFKGEHYYSWPLWYLLAIIYGSILLCFLLKCNCKKENIGILLIILFIVGQMIDYGVDNSLFSSNIIQKLLLTIGGGRIFRGIGYYMFGWVISKHDVGKNRFPPVLLIVFVAISIATYKSFV